MNDFDPEDPSPVYTPGFAMLQTLVGNSIFILSFILLMGMTGLVSVTFVAIATIIGYGAALALALPFIGDPPGPRLGFRPARARMFFAAALFVPSILIGSELENIFADFVPRAPAPEGESPILPSGVGHFVGLLVTQGVALPLVYQTFFYGLVQPRLERWWGSGGAVVGTALLASFGMSSVAVFFSRDPLEFVRIMIAMIGPALLYGLLRRASASVYPGIVASCGIGLLTAISSLKGYQIEGFTAGEGGHTPTNVLMLPALMVGVGLGLCRRPTAPPPEATDPASDAGDA